MKTSITFEKKYTGRPSSREKEMFPASACMKAFEHVGYEIWDLDFVETVAISVMQKACVELFDEASTLSVPVDPSGQHRDLKVEKNLKRIEECAIAISDSAETINQIAANFAARGLLNRSTEIEKLLHRLSSALSADYLNVNLELREIIRAAAAPKHNWELSGTFGTSGFAAVVSLAEQTHKELSEAAALVAIRSPRGAPSYPSEKALINLLADVYRQAFDRVPSAGHGTPTPKTDKSVLGTHDSEVNPSLSPNSPFCRFVEEVYLQMQLNLNEADVIHFDCPAPTTIASHMAAGPYVKVTSL